MDWLLRLLTSRSILLDHHGRSSRTTSKATWAGPSNPNGTDTATLGAFERANLKRLRTAGDKQLGTTTSGSYDLVTGALAGSSAGAYDLDGGTTGVRSPLINLPPEGQSPDVAILSGALCNSSSSGLPAPWGVGATTTTIFSEVGANNDDDAVWAAAHIQPKQL